MWARHLGHGKWEGVWVNKVDIATPPFLMGSAQLTPFFICYLVLLLGNGDRLS
jgi:hypothetical protein